MTSTQLRIAAILAGALLVFALFLGQQRLTYGDTSCGSAMNSADLSTALYGAGDVRGCNDLTDGRKGIALGVGLVGAAGLLGSLYGMKRKENAGA